MKSIVKDKVQSLIKDNQDNIFQMKPIEDFINEDNKLSKKTKIFLFRMEQGMMNYLDHYNKLTGNTRSQLIREAITDKTRSNLLIKKLLSKKELDENDYAFINKIMQEPY